MRFLFLSTMILLISMAIGLCATLNVIYLMEDPTRYLTYLTTSFIGGAVVAFALDTLTCR
jgi:hypothetical protein